MGQMDRYLKLSSLEHVQKEQGHANLVRLEEYFEIIEYWSLTLQGWKSCGKVQEIHLKNYQKQ